MNLTIDGYSCLFGFLPGDDEINAITVVVTGPDASEPPVAFKVSLEIHFDFVVMEVRRVISARRHISAELRIIAQIEANPSNDCMVVLDFPWLTDNRSRLANACRSKGWKATIDKNRLFVVKNKTI